LLPEFRSSIIIYSIVVRCVAITPTDANCTSEWVRHIPHDEFARGSKLHTGASTLTECQKVCELNPRCVAVDWNSYNLSCWINANPNHTHYGRSDWAGFVAHYILVIRCNFTTGQCFHGVLSHFLITSV